MQQELDRKKRKTDRAKSRRRHAISLWLFAATLPIILGLCGLVIDMGQLYNRRAAAQRAADAAALAGAIVSGGDNSKVIPTALEYARLNQYDNTKPGTRVIVTPTYASDDTSTSFNDVKVYVERKEDLYFAPIAESLMTALRWNSGAVYFSRNVFASATAEKRVRLPMALGSTYGIGDPSKSVVSNSIYGPYSSYNWGDPYSVKFLQDGSPNPRYAQSGGYENYTLNVTPEYLSKTTDSKVYLQIFDPDCYNPVGLYDYDEIRPPNPNITTENTGNSNTTVTQYEVYKDGKLVATANYGADPTTDQKWVTPQGFDLDLNTFGTGQYNIRIKALSGSSENAFQLRAGPKEGLSLNETDWNNQYGDKGGTDPNNVATPITADGRLMMNFNRDGLATVNLGYIGPEMAGKTVDVTKFDVDVGSQSITYKLDSDPTFSAPGVIPQPADGVWSTDEVTLPANFTGGTLSAQYVAADNDTSDWELSGGGSGDGDVRLIQ